jgi:gamma-glutamyltranspeptidase/glutathione hydrolase
MVVSNGPLGSEAGLEILAAGGNAVDAAVATGFALAVVFPSAGNIGGGGFAVIRMANGRTAALDYREMAPRAATRDMFVDPATGKLTNKSIIGHLASGVPGSVAGLLATLAKFGTMKRAEVMAPALRMARDGFVVDSALARSLGGDSTRARICRFNGCPTFYPNGRPLRPGDTLRQPALAHTLERIIAEGANGFYRGPVARAIAAEMQRGGGLITEQDLAAYKTAWRTPVTGHYHGHTIISMPPSSSGGVTIIETFNILDAFGPPAPVASATALERLLGAFQLAFIDRNEYIADPDMIKVPVAKLTDPAYGRAQRTRLADGRYVSTKLLSPGLAPREGEHTTHYSVVDRFGNAVATTTTINGSYGSSVWVPDAGFFLNNEMDDFAAQPGTPNMYGLVQGTANAVGPRKRMLSAMSPTVVLDPNGNVLLVIGSAGGPRIITGVAQIILNVIDRQMSLYDAMAAPRVHFQGLPEVVGFERGGFPQPVLDSLIAKGWKFDSGQSVQSSNIAIRRIATGWEGTFDPRTSGGVAGR